MEKPFWWLFPCLIVKLLSYHPNVLDGVTIQDPVWWVGNYVSSHDVSMAYICII